jgi:hypothetical protein
MTRQDLQRCDEALSPLVPREIATPVAREHARSFNESVAELRSALLDPARELFEQDAPLEDLAACLERAVAELAFWRRVLVRMHGEAFGPEPASSDYLLRYLTS